MTQDPMTSKKENTAPAQPSVPAAKEKESVKELLPLSPEHEALVSGMYDRLVKTVRTYNPGADFAQIDKAYHYAKDHHRGQLRKDGTPFITHPLAVAQIIAEELRLDSESIEAALMHDCIEDTTATYAEIAKEFSPAVADLVEGVSKLTRVQYASKEEEQMENLRKMLMAMAKDIRVILIKLADRTHNMRTMEYQTAEKQRQKSLETMEIYAPIAHRLGMQRIKWELEDLSLKYLDPTAFNEITHSLEEKSKEYGSFMERIQKQIEGKLTEDHIPFRRVYGRMKHPYSIYRKMYAQNKTMDEVLDLFAFRVIVDTVADCYNVLGIIHDMYKPLPGRFKDNISTPKPKPIRVSSSMEVCISRPEKFVTIAAVRVILITILLSTWKSLSLKNPTRRSAQPNRMMPIKHPACVRISTTVSPSLSLKLHDILLFVYIILCTCRQVILRPNRIIFLRQPSCIYGSKRLFYKYHKPYHFLRAGFSGTQHTERACILIWLVQQFWLAEKLLMMALP